MTTIRSVYIQNIRSHREYNLILSPHTTTITGKNGVGKTSLLEALYIALQGTSFRGSDTELITHGCDWYHIDLSWSDDIRRSVTFEPEKPAGKKKFVINEKTSYRLTTANKYPVVIFEPEDLRLINGSPSRRRLFIDRFISQINPNFHQAVVKYDKALRQRNKLLKQHELHKDELFVWNTILAQYGAYITTERIQFIEKLNQQLSEKYITIAGGLDDVAIHYSETLVGDVSSKLLAGLEASFQKDRLLGYTSIGPHRSDIVISLNGMPAIQTASRGENRTIILALKLLEADLLYDLVGKKPLVLLDDVFSELDDDRQRNISETGFQTVITSTTTPENLKFKTIKL